MARPSIQQVLEQVNGQIQTKLRPRVLHDTFELDGRTYPLFIHQAQRTWRSERIAEVAIGKAIIDDAAGKRVLEIGAVLPQYLPGSAHTVVDKYEQAPGVINEDAETFQADPFDVIVSLSTIEHIGWDETPRDPGKIPRVISHLRDDLLKSGGTLTITVPWRWNRDLDDLLLSDGLPFDRVSWLKRVDPLNRRWVQVDPSELGAMWYGYPFVGAHAIAVATLQAPA